MEKEEIRHLLALGEGQETEFKRKVGSQIDKGLQCLCGMINAEPARGDVVFGVDDDGSVVGIEDGDRDALKRKVQQKADKFDPHATMEMYIVAHDKGDVLVVRATRSSPDLHDYDGRTYIREGSATRVVGRSERMTLIKRRNRDQHQGPWICDTCGAITTNIGFKLESRGGKSTHTRYYDHQPCGGQWWPA